MNNGSQKNRRQDAFECILREEFSVRVLNFNKPATEEAALLIVDKRKRGKIIEVRNAMICEIARARRVGVATRNVKHFETTDIPIINPWSK